MIHRNKGMNATVVWLLAALSILWGAVPSSYASSSDDAAEAGVLDLRGWNPGADRPVALTGPWEFYWNRLLEPNRMDRSLTDVPLSVEIPAQWQSYTLDNKPLPNEGYATYRLTFTLSENSAVYPLGLYVRNVATAYRLWINGVPAMGNGKVGADAKSMVPRNYPKASYFQPRPGVNEMVIQVSNFVQRTGGIWEGIELGDAEKIASLHRNDVMTWALIAGGLLLMAVYSVFLYLFRSREPAVIWFGLICLAVCVRSALLGPSFAYVLFPGLSWEWGVKLEYLSEIVTLVCMAVFVRKQYPREAVRFAVPVFGAALGGFGAFVLATPAKVYTQYLVPYILALLLPVYLCVLYSYIRAALRRRTGARVNATGFAVFFASVIHEILYYTGFVSFGGLVSYGMLFFLLTQLLNLSSMFGKALNRSEALSRELAKVIEAQEETIVSRTASLQELNRKLEQGNRDLTRLEQVRSTLLADAHHDLTTPLTSIKGFSKAIMTSVISEEAPQYARRIYERSLFLEKLIDNVFELSQLKTEELQFQFQELPLPPFLRQLTQKYESEALSANVSLRWENTEPTLLPSGEICAIVDPYRFERVFANLVGNAIKFTPGEGLVRVWIEFRPSEDPEEEEDRVVIHISDTGVGIPEPELPLIFERHYRSPSGPNDKTGSGLGLAICREIVARHRGALGASSIPGQGSDFWIALPALIRRPEANQELNPQGESL